MENVLPFPTEGGMPPLENLPTLLKRPIALLKKLSCVAGISSGHQQENCSATLRINFSDSVAMDYKSALSCFRVDGLAPKSLHINLADRFMQIKLGLSKQVLN